MIPTATLAAAGRRILASAPPELRNAVAPKVAERLVAITDNSDLVAALMAGCPVPFIVRVELPDGGTAEGLLTLLPEDLGLSAEGSC